MPGGASLVAQMVKNLPAMQETWFRSLGWQGSLEKGDGYPLHYSCLENPLDRGAGQPTVHGVAKSRTWLSGFHFTIPGRSFHFGILKEFADEIVILLLVIIREIIEKGEHATTPEAGIYRSKSTFNQVAHSAPNPKTSSEMDLLRAVCHWFEITCCNICQTENCLPSLGLMVLWFL